MRPLEPGGSGGAAAAAFAPVLLLGAAFAGLAALETVADFAVLRTEGKRKF